MADWEALHRRLWREVLSMEHAAEASAQEVIGRLLRTLAAEGETLGPEAQAELERYFAGVQRQLGAAIAAAITPTAAAAGMRSEAIAALAEEAYTRRWRDGLKLSTRVWDWQQRTANGVSQVLRQQIRAGRSVSGLVYDLQRQIEASAGRKFAIEQQWTQDWVDSLIDSARSAIRTPAGRKAWRKLSILAGDHVTSLREQGTKRAAEQALATVLKAVKTGQEDLLADAMRWWIYDRQLYGLKRIARSEMATAQHRAVIASTRDSADVIGYHWRLSGSHAEPDICDYYADVDLGLGQGVWPKDQVPEEKAHPQCMCSLVPRAEPLTKRGSGNYADFLGREGMAEKILPGWALALRDQGVDVGELVRADGLGVITRAEATGRWPEKFA